MSGESSSSIQSVEQKLNVAKQKKETADQAFKLGEVKDALRSYHESLMYLLGLDKNALKSMGMVTQPASTEDAKDGKAQEKTEVDEMVEKIYSNMAACHIKNGNWKRATEAAEKALAKNENNYKAMFRKGKALGEQGFFEKAEKVLEDLKTKNPTDAGIADQEIARLRVIDKEREKASKQQFKGFLNKGKTIEQPAS
ncbi:TPR-like protein [Coprinellus micaceus]|uniref:TPR-like protein n=1 Tax=Coprinellus micaceus TaxID=71717 RepID=A0A4Y7STH7_COPMI|nr:TPR-like protein [Coprinellus micaceus]